MTFVDPKPAPEPPTPPPRDPPPPQPAPDYPKPGHEPEPIDPDLPRPSDPGLPTPRLRKCKTPRGADTALLKGACYYYPMGLGVMLKALMS